MERKTGIHKVKLQSYLLIPYEFEDRYITEISSDHVVVKIAGWKDTPFTFDSSFVMGKQDDVSVIPNEFLHRLECSVQMVTMGYASTLLCYFPHSIHSMQYNRTVMETILQSLYKPSTESSAHSNRVEMACYELLDNQIRDLLIENGSYRNVGTGGGADIKLRDAATEGQMFVDGVSIETFPDYSNIANTVHAALNRRIVCIGGRINTANAAAASSKTLTELANSLQPELLGNVGNCVIQLRVITTDSFTVGDKSHTLNKTAMLSVVFLATNDTLLAATEFKGYKAFTEQGNILYNPIMPPSSKITNSTINQIAFVTMPQWISPDDHSSRNNQLRNALKSVATLTRVVNALVEKNELATTHNSQSSNTGSSNNVMNINNVEGKQVSKTVPGQPALPPIAATNNDNNSKSKVSAMSAASTSDARKEKSVVSSTASSSTTNASSSTTTVHIPFRDSLLTRMLKPSLAGNCFLSMVTIPPDQVDSASRALRFASQISQLYNIVWIKEALAIHRLFANQSQVASASTDANNDTALVSDSSSGSSTEKNEVVAAGSTSSHFDTMIHLMKEEISLFEEDLAKFERAREFALQQLAIGLQPLKTYELSRYGGGKTNFELSSLSTQDKDSSNNFDDPDVENGNDNFDMVNGEMVDNVVSCDEAMNRAISATNALYMSPSASTAAAAALAKNATTRTNGLSASSASSGSPKTPPTLVPLQRKLTSPSTSLSSTSQSSNSKISSSTSSGSNITSLNTAGMKKVAALAPLLSGTNTRRLSSSSIPPQASQTQSNASTNTLNNSVSKNNKHHHHHHQPNSGIATSLTLEDLDNSKSRNHHKHHHTNETSSEAPVDSQQSANKRQQRSFTSTSFSADQSLLSSSSRKISLASTPITAITNTSNSAHAKLLTPLAPLNTPPRSAGAALPSSTKTNSSAANIGNNSTSTSNSGSSNSSKGRTSPACPPSTPSTVVGSGNRRSLQQQLQQSQQPQQQDHTNSSDDNNDHNGDINNIRKQLFVATDTDTAAAATTEPTVAVGVAPAAGVRAPPSTPSVGSSTQNNRTLFSNNSINNHDDNNNNSNKKEVVLAASQAVSTIIHRAEINHSNGHNSSIKNTSNNNLVHANTNSHDGNIVKASSASNMLPPVKVPITTTTANRHNASSTSTSNSTSTGNAPRRPSQSPSPATSFSADQQDATDTDVQAFNRDKGEGDDQDGDPHNHDSDIDHNYDDNDGDTDDRDNRNIRDDATTTTTNSRNSNKDDNNRNNSSNDSSNNTSTSAKKKVESSSSPTTKASTRLPSLSAANTRSGGSPQKSPLLFSAPQHPSTQPEIDEQQDDDNNDHDLTTDNTKDTDAGDGDNDHDLDETITAAAADTTVLPTTTTTTTKNKKRSQRDYEDDDDDKDDKDEDGLTVTERKFLRAVATCNYADTIACLEAGVNIHVKNTFERDAMQIAARQGSVSMLQLLSEHGGSLSTRGPKGDTLLHLAAYNGHVDVLRWLLGNNHSSSHNNNNKSNQAHGYNNAYNSATYHGNSYNKNNHHQNFNHSNSTNKYHAKTAAAAAAAVSVPTGPRVSVLFAESVDMYGQNLVHIAAKRGETSILQYLQQESGLSEHCFTQMDFDGRTPSECVPRRSHYHHESDLVACRRFFEDLVVGDEVQNLTLFFAKLHGIHGDNM